MKEDIIWLIEVIVAVALMVISGGVTLVCILNIYQYGVNWPVLIVSIPVLFASGFYYDSLMEG